MNAEPEYVASWEDEPAPDYDSEPPDLPADELQALDRANWHLRVIAGIRAERAAFVANCDAEIARLTMRRDARASMLERQEAWWARPVLSLHRMLRLANPKRTSIALACGTLKSKAQQPEWKYAPDEQGAEHPEEFIAWARKHRPELLAPRTVSITVPDAGMTSLWEALLALDNIPAEALSVSDPAPAKAAVKQALVKRDEKQKPLVLGVDPESGERPPGLTVSEREPEFSIDTDPDN